MVSRIEGERLLIAATLDPVVTGQEFARIPPHMTIVRWFQMQENRQFRVTGAMDRLFTEQDVYQHLVGGRRARFGEEGEFTVRTLKGAETGQSFALRALVRSMGHFRADDIYADTFSPHVTRMPGYTDVRWRQKIAIPTVALISAHSDEKLQHVVESFPLAYTPRTTWYDTTRFRK